MWREQRGHVECVGRQRGGTHAIGKAGNDGWNLDLEAVAHRPHLGRALDPVIGHKRDDGQRARRGTERAAHRGVDAEGLTRYDAGVTGLDLEDRAVRQRVQPRGARDATHRCDPDHQHYKQGGRRRDAANDRPTHVPTRYDLVDLDGPRLGRRVDQDQVTKRRRSAPVDHLRGTGKPVLEVGAALLDEARDLPIAWHAMKRPQRPYRIRGRDRERHHRERDHRDIGRLKKTIDGENEQQQGQCDHGGPRRRARRPRGHPPASHLSQQGAQIVEVGLLH